MWPIIATTKIKKMVTWPKWPPWPHSSEKQLDSSWLHQQVDILFRENSISILHERVFRFLCRRNHYDFWNFPDFRCYGNRNMPFWIIFFLFLKEHTIYLLAWCNNFSCMSYFKKICLKVAGLIKSLNTYIRKSLKIRKSASTPCVWVSVFVCVCVHTRVCAHTHTRIHTHTH